MIRDAQTNLFEAAALTATALSTNAFDCGAAVGQGAAPDISVGKAMGVILSVGVAAKVSATNETYEFDIIQSANANLSASQVVGAFTFTNAQAAALLTQGAIIVLPLQPGAVTQRYLGLNYISGGTAPSITVTAWLAPLDMVQLASKFYGTLISVL